MKRYFKRVPTAALIILAIISACTKQKEERHIQVVLTPTELIVENVKIEKTDFGSTLQKLIGQKEKAGVARKEITIRLRVHEETRRGDIADIETELRKNNVKKVVYSTFRTDQED